MSNRSSGMGVSTSCVLVIEFEDGSHKVIQSLGNNVVVAAPNEEGANDDVEKIWHVNQTIPNSQAIISSHDGKFINISGTVVSLSSTSQSLLLEKVEENVFYVYANDDDGLPYYMAMNNTTVGDFITAEKDKDNEPKKKKWKFRTSNGLIEK